MEERLAALERRMDQLEQQAAAPAGTPDVGRRGVGSAALDLVHHYRNQAAEGGTGGTVAYGGAAFICGFEFLWTGEHQVDDLMAADWTAAAATLESMGSPARLALLAALAGGPRGRAELQDALGAESSTGHLYHHLRELQRGGLIRQPRRGTYEIVGRALIPLLAILSAALDVGPGSPGVDDPAPPSETEPE
ncbi:helix-turn-helix domain-containing protein [Nonomuraea sp. NBC_00507]|uniref:helix-turn-helix domain-containing protein n=1 Tax=Nonomuraea sp. NBC_00507 TaxID=2976002 RepID=UPI002E175CB5